MFGNYFDGKRVLVTGVSGVKGTWLALMLLDAGAIVTGLDRRLAALRSNYTATGLGGRITFVHGDVTDLVLVRQLVEKADCVFHLAAEAIVGEADRNPLETYGSNTLGTATILEALRTAGSPKRAVFITTDKVYRPKPAGEPWAESDELGADWGVCRVEGLRGTRDSRLQFALLCGKPYPDCSCPGWQCACRGR